MMKRGYLDGDNDISIQRPWVILSQSTPKLLLTDLKYMHLDAKMPLKSYTKNSQ